MALTVLAEAVPDAHQLRRFEQEARAASALNHPNILTVHDVGSYDGRPYMVTELVDGETLRTLIKRGPLTQARLLDLACQIANGLAAAHNASIVHRDLKPENVIVARDGRAKILDFGVAKVSCAVGNEETLTQPGTILGTVAYMSPEQVAGAQVDFRTDQFSFGLMLYEMATGQRAFQRNTPAETMADILRDEAPPFPAETHLSPALRWAIGLCLAKEPAGRWGATIDLYRVLSYASTQVKETVVPLTSVGSRPQRLRALRRPSGIWGRPAGLALADFLFDLPFRGISLTPGGKSFTTSMLRPQFDIWLLERTER